MSPIYAATVDAGEFEIERYSARDGVPASVVIVRKSDGVTAGESDFDCGADFDCANEAACVYVEMVREALS